MDARQIQVFRGAMHLLAHKDVMQEHIEDRDITTAIQVAHQTLGVVEEFMASPVEKGTAVVSTRLTAHDAGLLRALAAYHNCTVGELMRDLIRLRLNESETKTPNTAA